MYSVFKMDKFRRLMESRTVVYGIRNIAAAAFGLSMGLVTNITLANPENPTVVAGTVEFNELANQLQITNSPGSIINWQGFSINQNEITQFLQQSNQSAVLNRITGPDISNLLGQLISNGKVFVINPNGLVIGAGARIDAAGFVGSTLNISDQDFLSGNFRFSGSGGAIINNGAITAGPNGEVVLIAPTIQNSGSINALNGEIILAAGREVILTSLNNENISFRISSQGDEVLNLGSLVAQNGAIGVFANQIVNSGSISANRVSQDVGGRIVLQADGSNQIAGEITALGTDANGGEIRLLGDSITLQSASVDVTGRNGGRVLIGGEFQGRGSLPRARQTLIDQNSVVHADALTQGNGGEIIAWSEVNTQTFGRLTARGGADSGNGGLVETSSRGSLSFGQPADVSASNGVAGTWLLDPEDIVIDSGGADSISSALNGGSNVEIKTADSGSGEGNITVAAPITKSEGEGDAALSLTAHNQIAVNAPIQSTSGRLHVSLHAGTGISVNAGIATNGGNYSASIIPSLSATSASNDTESTDSGSETKADAGAGAESKVNSAVDSNEVKELVGGTPSVTATKPDTTKNNENVAEVVQQSETNKTGPVTPQPNVNEVAQEVVVASVAPTQLVSEPPEQIQPEQLVEVVAKVNQEAVPVMALPVDPISQTGITLLASIETAGGNLTLDAGSKGLLSINTTIDSSNEQSGAQGGDIQLLGYQVGIFDESVVDASGAAGGGEILIGGDQQGQNPEVPNSDAVFVSETAVIKSDALDAGDGGKVIVYADRVANIHGKISARGGVNGGDGGFVETSGKESLSVSHTPDISAPAGDPGSWLIDPDQIDIIDDNISAPDNTNIPATNPFVSTGNAQIKAFLIRSALIGGANVAITTANSGAGTGDINWLTDLNLNNSRSLGDPLLGSLTLTAINDINFQGSIFDSDILIDDNIQNLQLDAGGDVNIIGNMFSPFQPRTLQARGDIIITADNFVATGGFDPGQSINVIAGGALDIRVNNEVRLLGGVGLNDVNVISFGSGSVLNATNLVLGDSNGGVSTLQLGDSGAAITGVVTLTGNLTMEGGSQFSNGNITANSIDLIAGFFSENGTVNTNVLNWTAGIFENAGLTTTGLVTIDGGGTRSVGTDAIWNIANTSTVNWNNGDIDLDGRINNAGIFNALSDGDFIPRSDPPDRSPRVFNNTGTFNRNGPTPGSVIEFGIADKANEAPYLFVNSGTLNVQQGDLIFYEARDPNLLTNIVGGFVQTGGVINLAGGNISSQISTEFGFPTLLPGSLEFQGGTLTGGVSDTVFTGGNIFGDVATTNTTISPGQSPGSLNFNGNLTTNPGTIFEIEIFGTAPGQFDTINVTGTAQLNNPTLNVTHPTYVPPVTLVNDRFNVISALTLAVNPGVTVNQPALVPGTIATDGVMLGAMGEFYFLDYVGGGPIPPVVTPPVVTPPIVTPPVVTPPVIIPPVVVMPPIVNPVLPVIPEIVTTPGFPPNLITVNPIVPGTSLVPVQMPSPDRSIEFDSSDLTIALLEQLPRNQGINQSTEFLQCF